MSGDVSSTLSHSVRMLSDVIPRLFFIVIGIEVQQTSTLIHGHARK